MNKTPCHYALLRFRPYAETGEFANVGIVMIAPEAQFFDYRIVTTFKRITQFFTEMDRAVFLNGREIIKAELERLADQIDSCKDTPEVTTRLFGELVRQRDSLFQFDAMRVALDTDPKACLARLYSYYVERSFATKAYHEEMLERSIGSLLRKSQTGPRYIREKIGDSYYSVQFPFVRKDDERSTRIIKPLYLAYSDTNRILNHGGQWVDHVRRLRNRNSLPADVLFAVQPPPSTGSRLQAYEEIKFDLVKEDIQVVSAVNESEILLFAYPP